MTQRWRKITKAIIFIAICFILTFLLFLPDKPQNPEKHLAGAPVPLSAQQPETPAYTLQDVYDTGIRNAVRKFMNNRNKILNVRQIVHQTQPVLHEKQKISRVVVRLKEGQSLAMAKIEQAGARIIYRKEDLVSLEFPQDQENKIFKLLSPAGHVRKPLRFQAYDVVSEGVALTGVDKFRVEGFSGAGVKVAIIDLGFKGLAGAQAGGDLPDSVVSRDFTDKGLQTQHKHGTGCAEIVHDMAPDAELHLLKIDDEVDFYEAFDYCIENEIDIITLSIGTAGSGPGNGTGPLADKCNEARDHGILVVAAAGNSANQTEEGYTFGSHWEGTFTDSDGDNNHNFTSSLNYNVVVAGSAQDDDGNPINNELSVTVRWNDWPYSDTDYDLYLYDYDSGNLVASSTIVQDGTQQPVEIVSTDIPDSVEFQIFKVVVTRKNDEPVGKELEIYTGKHCLFIPFSGYSNSKALSSSGSSMAEPADTESVLAVGAVDYVNWETGPQEEFSSQGPTNPWAGSEARVKPDIVGPDGVTTFTYGANGFYGTSATAPLVAGAAAVLKEKYPFPNPDRIQYLLKYNAKRDDTDYLDNETGWGKLSLTDLSMQISIPIRNSRSSDLTCILRDDARDRVYVGDSGNNQVVVIDTITERIIKRIPIQSNINDMAISKDNTMLATAGDEVFLVDLQTLEAELLPTESNFKSVAFDYNGDIFLSNEKYVNGKIFHYDTNTKSLIKYIGYLNHSLYNGLVRTDKSGKNLFILLSSYPTIYKFDVSQDVEIPPAVNKYNSLDDIYSLHIPPLSNMVYIDDHIIDKGDLQLIDELSVDENSRYTKGVTSDKFGHFIYSESINHISKTSSVTNTLYDSFFVQSEHIYGWNPEYIRDQGITVDRTGNKVFIIHGIQSWQVKVVDFAPPVSLVLPNIVLENAGLLDEQGTINLQEAHNEDLLVNLTVSDPQRIITPNSFIIPAGTDSLTFDITILPDEQYNETQTVAIYAEVSGYSQAVGTIDILDNEPPILSLKVQSSFSEGDGTIAQAGFVTTNVPPRKDLLIALRTNDPSEISIPATIVIPAGMNTAVFDLTVIDDSFFDGVQEVLLTASIPGVTQTSSMITILDNENNVLELSVPAVIGEGVVTSDAGVVSIPGVAVNDIQVDLFTDGSTKMIIPSSVNIPANGSSVSFTITTIGDQVIAGDQNVTIQAKSIGWIDAVASATIVENWRKGDLFPVIDASSAWAYNCLDADRLVNGGFVAVFNGIVVQLFNSDGSKKGEEIYIIYGEPYQRLFPVVSSLSNGGFVVAWDEYPGSYAQIFSEQGEKVGNEIYSDNSDWVSVSNISSDCFIITWQTEITWNDTDIFAQLYDYQGNKIGENISVNTYKNGNQTNPSVAGVFNDNFVVVWQSGASIRVQIFDQYGNKIGDEFSVNPDTGGDQEYPSVVQISNDKFIVVWEAGNNIIAQLVNHKGEMVGEAFQINSYDLGSKGKPSVARISANKFVITWDSWNFNTFDVFARIFDDTGIAVSKEFQVNMDSSERHRNPVVISNSTNEFIVVWEHNPESLGQIHSLDTDRDDDGLHDAMEDSNLNGIVDHDESDPTQPDTDGDGILDGTEYGLTMDMIDQYTDTSVFIPDSDPSTKTCPWKADSDDDGLADNEEDVNLNGRLDAGESDPDLLAGDVDHDWDVRLSDAITVLKVISSGQGIPEINLKADVNNDGRIGIQEAFYVLEKVANQ